MGLSDGSTAAEAIPRKIGPYKIEALLNKGGMSYLYLAEDPATGTNVTIKVLSKKYHSHPDAVKRFLREAEIISMTDHPNIVKLLAHGEWEGGLYIAMECIQGISLRKYLLQTPISLKSALSIILDIAYALCHLHVHGVIHRDLKPENILITEKNEIKVIDFGISQLLTEKEKTSEVKKHHWLGTPIYISPEQKENPDNVSFPSDIYSLGIIAYELILGKPSLGHVHLSLMPRGMQHILIKSLQTKPVDRYQDIVEFITDVSAYLNSPNLQKEKILGDQLSEISEDFRETQKILSAQQIPSWPGLDIDAAFSKGLKLRGVFYDFVEIDDTEYGVILVEARQEGAQSVAAAAMFRGLLQGTLRIKENPEQTLILLNNRLYKEKYNVHFNVMYLAFNKKDSLLRCISCGQGSFIHIPAGTGKPENYLLDTVPIGISKDIVLKESVLLFEKGDLCLIHTVGTYFHQKENRFSISDDLAAEFMDVKKADSILRKIMLASGHPFSMGDTQILVSLRKDKEKGQ